MAQAAPNQAIVKASWRILPLLGLAYLVAYMDRVNISFAAVQMNDDLGFSATVYGIGAGMFFAAYAMFEVPSNIVMMRFGPRRWIARIMISWGILSAAMMFVTLPWHFYTLRFLIGFAEAGFFPAVVYYLAHWFPTAQRGRAISRFYVFGAIGTMVMGIVSSWLLDLDGIAGLRGWQWLFLVEGLPAVAIGLLVLRCLPDTPVGSRWLTAVERDWLVAALVADAEQRGDMGDHNILQALKNPLVPWLGALGFIGIGVYLGFTFSAPEVLMQLADLTIKQAGYVISLSGALGALVMLFTGWFSDRSGDRFPLLILCSSAMVVGLVTIAAAPSPTLVILGFLLFGGSFTAVTVSQVMLWADLLPLKTLAVGAAAINTVSQVGAFVSPILLGMAKDATGRFETGIYGLALAMLVATLLCVALRRKVAHDRAAVRLGPGLAKAGMPAAQLEISRETLT